MEELRSTEALDKEILSDARKKAEKALTDSESESSRILADVSIRLKKSEEERNSFYDAKIKQFQHNGEASLPLEKQRYLVSYIDKSVSEAIDSYLKSISQEKRFELIKSLFKKARNIFTNKKINALVYGFEVAGVEKYLSGELGENLLSVQKTSFEKTGQSATGGITVHEGVILEADDKSVKCRLTLEELVCEIKEKQGKILADKLFCGRIPE